MANGWKITSIIFICLFVALLAFNVWSISYVLSEEESINQCYYNICSDFPDAWYEAGVCTCYMLDEDGGYEVAMTSYGYE